MTYLTVEHDIPIIEKLRERARRDFLFANCVTVESGPYTVDDEDWANRVEAAFEDFQIPVHQGRRYLLFLKTQVITTIEEHNAIIRLCMNAEISEEGVARAIRGYAMKWDGDSLFDHLDRLEGGKFSHNLRFWEARAAKEYNIPFNSEWYDLPVTERENMVAALLGAAYSESLAMKDTTKRV